LNEKLKEKINEALSSVLPITLIVLVLSIIVIPMEVSIIVTFLMGAVLLIVGMGFFSLGADMAMMPMGEGMGTEITKVNKLWLMIGIIFLMGFVITIAEPDLEVLARQVSAIPDTILILTVAVGVGLFLVIALLRILFHISLPRLLVIFYGIALIISMFVPKNFIALAFDSGGVTTGPMTVPFILALGVGLASMRSDKDSHGDSFGLVALCSIGPIIAVMILGILYHPESSAYEQVVIAELDTMQDVSKQFALEFPTFIKEVIFALAPVCLFFIIFQALTRKFTKRKMIRMTIGIVYTFIGLVLFLTGVNVGFIPVGTFLGSELASPELKWLLIPLGMLMGYYIVAAEPAVHVLNKQVEEVSGGAIPASAMNLCLSIGVAVSVGLSMMRVLTGISIYWLLIPGYVIALLLSNFVPKMFTGIAFDSGGVASGPMTTTFLLPFAMGACIALDGNILTDAFGIVAMVAMTPLIAVQLMGLIYQRKINIIDDEDEDEFPVLCDDNELSVSNEILPKDSNNMEVE
jgi:intracellular septation protein A